MKSKVVVPPPGVFQKNDVYCIKQWRAAQHLTNEFWGRIKKGYLQVAQERPKWNRAHPNLAVYGVVLIKDEDTPRNKWTMGRVIGVFPSEDGLV